MLQVDLKTYASDVLEDAMRLAQTKALNSYSWSDMLNYLNYAWSDIYNRIACIDDGYYSTTVRLNTVMTKLPPFVKNTLRVYSAELIVGRNRDVFRASGMNDLTSRSTYHLSGFDLYCRDATQRVVWLSYVPIAPQLFFTRNNRDPKLYHANDKIEAAVNDDYGLYHLERGLLGKAREYIDYHGNYEYLILRHKNPTIQETFDLLKRIELDDPDWVVHYVTCDYPYIFVTYRHRYLYELIEVPLLNDDGSQVQFTQQKQFNVFKSGFYKDVMNHCEFYPYNPFDYTGRPSNVEYLQCKYNDKTGLGVIVRDWNDYDEKEKHYRIKELGWTPDSIVTYPSPEAYRFLVAKLADKLAAINETNVMGVAKELGEAQYAFEAFLAKDKSAWGRIDNVNGPYLSDWL